MAAMCSGVQMMLDLDVIYCWLYVTLGKKLNQTT